MTVVTTISLSALAADIRAEHEACERDARSAVEHAIRAGELLAEAKAQIKHGAWLPWLEANFDGTRSLAAVYMRLAANVERVAHFDSVRAALKELAEPRDEQEQQAPREPTREERITAELATLLSDDERHAVMTEAVAEFGDEPTVDQVREIVSWYRWPPEESCLRQDLRVGCTIVVNQQRHQRLIAWAEQRGLYVRIDRATPWGNPFETPADGDRATVIANYRDHYLPHKPSLLTRVGDLGGRALGCWCHPEACHGDVLQEAADEAREAKHLLTGESGF